MNKQKKKHLTRVVLSNVNMGEQWQTRTVRPRHKIGLDLGARRKAEQVGAATGRKHHIDLAHARWAGAADEHGSKICEKNGLQLWEG